MKITILLRYPKVEKNKWKIELIDKLINDNYEVSIIFGESSYWRHLRVALKEYGLEIFKTKKSIDSEKSVKLYNYYKDKLYVAKVNDLNSQKSESVIKKINPDYILLLGSGIIRKNILILPQKCCVHCHHGYLPDIRGVSTAEWSIYLNNKVYITTHIVDPGVDTGDILARREIPLTREDTIVSVRKKCRVYSVDLLYDTFKMLKSGEFKEEKQSKADGKQYFLMHPFFKNLVDEKLAALNVK